MFPKILLRYHELAEGLGLPEAGDYRILLDEDDHVGVSTTGVGSTVTGTARTPKNQKLSPNASQGSQRGSASVSPTISPMKNISPGGVSPKQILEGLQMAEGKGNT